MASHRSYVSKHIPSAQCIPSSNLEPPRHLMISTRNHSMATRDSMLSRDNILTREDNFTREDICGSTCECQCQSSYRIEPQYQTDHNPYLGNSHVHMNYDMKHLDNQNHQIVQNIPFDNDRQYRGPNQISTRALEGFTNRNLECCSESESSRSESCNSGLSRPLPPPRPPDRTKFPPRISSPADQGYHTLPPWPGTRRTHQTLLDTKLTPSTHQHEIHRHNQHQHDLANTSGYEDIDTQSTPVSQDYFDRLTDDLVLTVLSWLDARELARVAMTCRRLSHLSWSPSLWRSITLKSVNDKSLRLILRRLARAPSNTRCPTQLGHGVFCPEVERIMLAEDCAVSDRGVSMLARKCPELTHLQVANCRDVTDLAVDDVIVCCENLRHLDLTGCSGVSRISCPIVYQQPESATTHSNHNSNGANSSSHAVLIHPPPRAMMRSLLLQYLDLTDCLGLDDSGLHVTVRSCPQLLFLYLRRCTGITDTGLKFVPLFCSGLRELSLSDCGSGVTDFGLYELARLGSSLRYLSVAKCERVSDAGLKVIARRCYKLRYLNCRGCEAVSDDSVTVLSHSCPRLRALDVGKCDVSDSGLKALAESCPNLKKLSLRGCDMIGDRGVQCIAYYCRGLQQLNIQDCQVTLEGYRAVKKYCRRCVIEHTNPGFY